MRKTPLGLSPSRWKRVSSTIFRPLPAAAKTLLVFIFFFQEDKRLERGGLANRHSRTPVRCSLSFFFENESRSKLLKQLSAFLICGKKCAFLCFGLRPRWHLTSSVGKPGRKWKIIELNERKLSHTRTDTHTHTLTQKWRKKEKKEGRK